MPNAHFTPALFTFLRQLKKNNSRDWFNANKARYIEQVRDPMLAFIEDLAPRMEKISPYIVVDARPTGGSMFRIYRDTRFSKDKSPYKTAATAQFRHEAGKDVHAPGFYLHLGLDGVFFGSGIWQPDSPSLKRIRDRIIEDPGAWKKLVTSAAFKNRILVLHGESLKRPPRGYDPEHPAIEDLKRKDFVTFTTLDEQAACEPGFLSEFVGTCRKASPFMRYIAEALDLDY